MCIYTYMAYRYHSCSTVAMSRVSPPARRRARRRRARRAPRRRPGSRGRAPLSFVSPRLSVVSPSLSLSLSLSLYLVISFHYLSSDWIAKAKKTSNSYLKALMIGWHYLSKATCLIRPHVFYGITCLIRLIEFAALFTTFEENRCKTRIGSKTQANQLLLTTPIPWDPLSSLLRFDSCLPDAWNRRSRSAEASRDPSCHVAPLLDQKVAADRFG